MKKRILSLLLTAALAVTMFPAAAVKAAAAELEEAYTLTDDYISVSVSKRNGGFTVRTVEGDRLKKSDNNKDLLYHDGQYDTSFVSLRVGEGSAARDYIFGGQYPGSSAVNVTEGNGAIRAEWRVDGLTFTQSISLTNNSSNESGMVSLSLTAANSSGAAVPVKARILYDTALGSRDYGYYQYTDLSTQKAQTISSETELSSVPDQLFAVDDPYSPSIAAYSVSSGAVKPYRAVFGHWNHLAGTLFDFTPNGSLDFTGTRTEYMTADSAYALYYDLGRVAANGSAAVTTFYGVFSNHQTPASDSVAVNLTAPVRLTLDDRKENFVQQTGAKGSAHFSVTADFANIAAEGAQDLKDIALAVQTTGRLKLTDDNGSEVAGRDFTSTDPVVYTYSELKAGASLSKTLNLMAKPGTDAAYERITVGVYDYTSGQLSETNKLGERMAYVLLPGTDNDVPKVSFASMTPKIIYISGTRHLFVTVTNEAMLTDRSNWNLKAYSEDRKVSRDIPHTNITVNDGVMDVALTDDIQLSEGGWYLQLEWADAAVSSGLVPKAQQYQTAPELHFTVSADRKYKNDAYGVLAVIEQEGSGSQNQKNSYYIQSFKDEAAFEDFKKTGKYEEILLTFKGEFTQKPGTAKAYYTATSTKNMVNGASVVDNPIVINDCMDFEGGSLNVYYDKDGAICTEFDGDLYTNGARTSIRKGKAIFTKIEQGKAYSLIPYSENGERAAYLDNGTRLDTENPGNFTDKPISLIWPSAAGIGQTLSGMIFKMAYAQLGVMYDTDEHNRIQETLGGVVTFTAALDLTFASGKVDESANVAPSYFDKLRELWWAYEDSANSNMYNYVYADKKIDQALDWSAVNEEEASKNEKHIKGSAMVRDVLFGCGQGFVGVNFSVSVAIKNYVASLGEIEGTIAVNTVNNWSYSLDGKIDLTAFTVEAKVSFRSRNNVPVPDELYVFVSGFEPGLNIDGLGVVWITGGGGGIKNLYDTIFCTQTVPPLKLLLSVSFDIVKVLSCEKATLSLGMTGISLQAQQIGIKKIPELTAIQRMGLSFEWYPGIDLRANMVVDLLGGVIYGGGYIVLISPDYKDVFFEMFARAQLRVPGSVPVVGGMTLAGIDLGISSEKIWGALDVLFITLGVTYYWGESSPDFSSGSKTQPTFPELLGYDDIPVYCDEEEERTLYARVGTNTQLMASSLDDTGDLTLLDSSALHCTDRDRKTKYTFNLGTKGANDAIIQIMFDAKSEAEARGLIENIKVGSSDGADDYGRTLYTQTVDENGNLKSSNINEANASLVFANGRATYAFTATDVNQYSKNWYVSNLPDGSDMLLYNVSEVPEMKNVSGTLNGNQMTLSWDGTALADLDKVSFYLASSTNPGDDPGYRLGEITTGFDSSKGATLTVPADVPSGEYYVRAVYSKTDEVNGVAYSTDKISWTNANTPGEVSFTAAPAGNLQYQLKIDDAANTSGYLVTIYDADGKATDFQQVSLEKTENGATTALVGGQYQAFTQTGENAPQTTDTFGLTGGQSYTIGVTPYKTVAAGTGGETAVMGAEKKSAAIALPEMKTPTVAFSANSAKQTRTETVPGPGKTTQKVTKDVFVTDTLTFTAKTSEAVSGTWRLDESETTTAFTSSSAIEIPLSSLADGEHTITMQGAAADGDSFAATCSFVVDTLAPQLLLSAPVSGSLFAKDGTLTIAGVTDEDARFTVTSGSATLVSGKTLSELGSTRGKNGAFRFTVRLPDAHSSAEQTITISASDDVGNRTAPESITVMHGGLADIKTLEVAADGQTAATGNLAVPAAGLKDVPLSLVATTSSGVRFNLSGSSVIWDILTVDGEASVKDGRLTAAALSQGIVTGRLAVAQSADNASGSSASTAYRTATLCFGAPSDHTVAVSATVGGRVTGGGTYQPGASVTLTAIPDSGYRFAGWTLTGVSGVDTSASSITFTMPQTGNVTAAARFEATQSGGGAGGSGGSGETVVVSDKTVEAKAGELVEVKIPDGTSEDKFIPFYTDTLGNTVFVPVSAAKDGYMRFIAPVTATYGFASHTFTFTDTKGHWAQSDIAFCTARDIFKGVGGGRFDPEGTMTRAMFVTVLYRLAGSPASGRAAFRDVPANSWYADAVSWAASNGIVKGYGNDLFGSDDLVTRAQMCTLIMRFLEHQGWTLSASASSMRFTDANAVPDWAADAVAFCQTRGLVNGRENAKFAPNAGATRAENCAVFQRLITRLMEK